MSINVIFSQSDTTYQERPATNIQFLVREGNINLGNVVLNLECSLGSFIVNGQDIGQTTFQTSTDSSGMCTVLIAGSSAGGDGQLTITLHESGQQIGVQSYHFKAVANYTLNFKVIHDNAMADGVQSNKVRAILTGTGSGANIANRNLKLNVTDSASFEKGSAIKATTVTTDTSGMVSFELYDTNKDGEAVTLTGMLDTDQAVNATTPVHFQLNLDCETSPPSDGIYIRSIFTYSINNQLYLLRQRQCDHLVTVHQLLSGGKMGEQTSTGQKWTHFYDLLFPFVLGKEQYIFGLAKNLINTSQVTYKSYWMIAKLDEKGHKEIIDSGYWDNSYDVGFAYANRGNQFIYLHSKDKSSSGGYPYIIQNIHPNGKIGIITDNGHRDDFYEATFSFSIKEKVYIYGQTRVNNAFFIYELDTYGTIGKLTGSGNYDDYFDCQFSYSFRDEHFRSGQKYSNNQWFISRMNKEGTLERSERSMTHGMWDTIYQYQVPFLIDNEQYFIRQNQSKDHWYIRELGINGDMMDSDTDSNNNH
ncbi:hypothetical protein Xbed_01932 [Xenorhabdus beddingii]|uniref:Big-1 domain-containing protein n=1 Tax=Xenorhabdus beddingii TaxID=40578 RepID=A0A1Y2SQN9_9GAMM|nr:Ig-like domain-containing protein [Xenorhabdus beddingii]OTA20001.1 hypothetical protein Xbed_01932 [Xenorhabdus beddingii]